MFTVFIGTFNAKQLYMKTFLMSIGLVAGLLTGAAAQIRSIGTQPLGGDPNAPQTAADKMANTPKYQKALKVFDRLVEARGDFRLPVPEFVMLKGKGNGRAAFMDYENNEVQLDENAYNACIESGFDTAGLAFLIGHELTHYYEKHGWRSGFAQEYSDLPIGLKINKMVDKVANETEADYLGGFLAYSAGYGLFEKGPELIEHIYKAYGWGTESVNYPSLSDRQALIGRTNVKLQYLVEVFEMANLLTAIGHYEEAYEYYRYVAIRYQSREIYNNLGVAKVLEAMDHFENNELVYRYPVQLDLSLSGGSKGSGAGEINRDTLLLQALLQFDAAISLDPNYAPAYLNKACAYALLGDMTRARFYAAEEARAAARKNNRYPKTAVDADVLLGILEAKSGNKDNAKKIFEAAAKDSSALAAINLKILNEDPLPKAPPEKLGLKAETIDGLKMSDVSHPADNDLCPKFDDQKAIQLTIDLMFAQNPAPGANSKSKVYICINALNEARNKDPMTIFHFTNPDNTGKTAKNIALGAAREEIVKAYGEAPKTIESPIGQMMVYSKIIFILQNNKLVRWINYTTRSSC